MEFNPRVFGSAALALAVIAHGVVAVRNPTLASPSLRVAAIFVAFAASWAWTSGRMLAAGASSFLARVGALPVMSRLRSQGIGLYTAIVVAFRALALVACSVLVAFLVDVVSAAPDGRDARMFAAIDDACCAPLARSTFAGLAGALAVGMLAFPKTALVPRGDRALLLAFLAVGAVVTQRRAFSSFFVKARRDGTD